MGYGGAWARNEEALKALHSPQALKTLKTLKTLGTGGRGGLRIDMGRMMQV